LLYVVPDKGIKLVPKALATIRDFLVDVMRILPQNYHILPADLMLDHDFWLQVLQDNPDRLDRAPFHMRSNVDFVFALLITAFQRGWCLQRTVQALDPTTPRGPGLFRRVIQACKDLSLCPFKHGLENGVSFGCIPVEYMILTYTATGRRPLDKNERSYFRLNEWLVQFLPRADPKAPSRGRRFWRPRPPWV
jgi:hypothetical protein